MDVDKEFEDILRRVETGSERSPAELLFFMLDLAADATRFPPRKPSLTSAALPQLPDADGYAAFANANFLRLFFVSLKWVSPADAAKGLRSLVNMLRNGSSLLIESFSRSGAISLVCDALSKPFVTSEILTQLLALLKLFLEFSVSVSDVQRIFSYLIGNKPEECSNRVYFWNDLLETLKSAVPRSAPDAYFSFSGVESGLELPLFKLPASGFGLSMWASFDSLSAPFSNDPSYSPVIASLLYEDLTGIQCVVEDKMICIRCSYKKGKAHEVAKAQFPTVELVPKKWYHFVFVFENHTFRKSEVSLYVNGALVDKQYMFYPSTPGVSLNQCTLACGPERHFQQYTKRFSMAGGMSNIFLFSEPPSKDEVAALYRLGFDPFSNPESMMSRRTSTITLKDRAVPVSFAYTASAMKGDLCMNIARQTNDGCASLLNGSYAVVGMPLNRALITAGGMSIILPLFRQIAQDFDLGPIDRNEAIEDYDALVSLLTFVLSLIKENREFFRSFRECRFFAVLVHICRQFLSPSIWTRQAIQIIQSFVPLVKNDRDIMTDYYSMFMFNFRYWMQTPVSVQLQIMMQLTESIKADPVFFRDTIGVQRILEVLRTCYYFVVKSEAPALSTEDDQENENANAQPEIVRSLLPESHIKDMRKSLIEIISTITNNCQFTVEEFKMLVEYVLSTDDEGQIVDVIELIITSIARYPAQKNNFFVACEKQIAPWFLLLSKKNPNIKWIVLKIICQLLATAPEVRPKDSKWPSALSDDVTLEDMLATLKMCLMQEQLTRLTFFALFEFLLGDLKPSATANPLLCDDQGNNVFENTFILPVIFDIIPACTVEVKESALTILNFFLEMFPNNVFILSEHEKWEQWLLNTLKTANNTEEADEGESHQLILKVAEAEKVLEIMYNLFANVYATRLVAQDPMKVKDDIIITNFFLVNIVLELENGQRNPYEFCLHIYRRTIEALRRRNDLMIILSENEPICSNIIFWCCICCVPILARELEDGNGKSAFTFFTSKFLRTAEGVWKDLQFARVLYYFFKDVYDIWCERGCQLPLQQEDELNADVVHVLFNRLLLAVLIETDRFVYIRDMSSKKTELEGLSIVSQSLCNIFSVQLMPYSTDPLPTAVSWSAYLTAKTSLWEDQVRDANNVANDCASVLLLLIEKITKDFAEEDRSLGFSMNKCQIMWIIENMTIALREMAETKEYNHLTAVIRGIYSHLFVEFGSAEFGIEEDTLTSSSLEKRELSTEGKELVQIENGRAGHVVEIWLDGMTMEGARLVKALDARNPKTLQPRVYLESAGVPVIEQLRQVESKKYSGMVLNNRLCKDIWRNFSSMTWPVSSGHWRMDMMENSLRMRRRLRPNFRFDPHRDLVASTQSKPVVPVETLSSMSAAVDVAKLEDDEEEMPEPIEPTRKQKQAASQPTDMHMEVEFVKIIYTSPGTLHLTKDAIEYKPTLSVKPIFEVCTVDPSVRPFKIDLADVKRVLPRRFLFKEIALEIFLEDRSAYFFNCKTDADRVKVLQWFGSKGLAKVTPFKSIPLGYSALLRQSGLTEAWVARRISNFEYIMQLNTLSGRSFNELSQYPVFPWVLADYTSPTLDLTNPNTFRDFSLPVGAQFTSVRDKLIQRYAESKGEWISSQSVPPYHHGTHWLPLGTVLQYLIRVEPFTSLFLLFQGGKFDHINRMFSSLATFFTGSHIDTGCTKELIPEFFCFPDFLRNGNRFNFGFSDGINEVAPTDDDGLVAPGIGDVILPPWAENSPEIFVMKHREALESEYVSQHLHEWIDLIWGFKQRGPNAVEALNTFYHMTYDNGVDFENVPPEFVQSVYCQIYNFGQIPPQLFGEPHPRRAPLAIQPPPMLFGSRTFHSAPIVQQQTKASIATMHMTPEFLFAWSNHGLWGEFRVINESTDEPRTLTVERDMQFCVEGDSDNVPGSVYLDFPSSDRILFDNIIAPAPKEHLLFVGGSWDGSISVFTWGKQFVKRVKVSSDVVTAVSFNNGFLAVGSQNSALRIFDLRKAIQTNAIMKVNDLSGFDTPYKTLLGHYGTIDSIVVSEESDCVLSCSAGAQPQCILHTLREGAFLRRLEDSYVSKARITVDGNIVLCLPKKRVIRVYSLNAVLMHEIPLDVDPYYTHVARDIPLAVSEKGYMFAYATQMTCVNVVDIRHHEPMMREVSVTQPATALTFACDDHVLIIGTGNSSIVAETILGHL